MASTVKIIPVKNRLGQLLRKPGGIARDEAISAATSNVESLRGRFIKAIPVEISALEGILRATGRENISKDELDAMLQRAGRLLTLSGTFGFALLDDVVKRFCDLAVGMIEKDIESTAPVAVHLRAMRLVCPGGIGMTEADANSMLTNLERVHAHLGITRLDTGETPQPVR